jgi:hypothetical protein
MSSSPPAALVSSGAPGLPGARRVVALDLLRLLAAFQMIQGHTLGGLAAPAALVGPLFAPWTFARGLTSVAFLFAAGLSFFLTTLVDLPRHLAHRAASRQRLRRAGLLVLLGYALHAPFGTPLAHALIVDVLQCTGTSLALAELLVLALRRARSIVLAAGAFSVSALLLAPHTAAITADGAFSVFANYVTRTGGSLFPLTPYAGFFFAGVVAGAVAFPQGAATPRGRSLIRLVLLAVLLRVSAVWIARVEVPLDPQVDVAFALRKLAFVVAALAVLALVSWPLARLPRVLERLSGETLVLYVVHLQLLYPAGIGLMHWVGPVLSLPAAMGVALALMIVSGAVALLWNERRGRRGSLRQRAPGGP